MAESLIVAPTGSVGAVGADAREYVERSVSASTRRRYRADYRSWQEYAGGRREPELPASPALVADWIAAEARAGKSVGTIRGRLASLASAHRAAGYPSPTEHPLVQRAMGGIARSLPPAGAGRKDPLLLDGLIQACAVCPDTAAGRRDHAILTLGWAGAFRRSELAALVWEDVEDWGMDGIVVNVRRSKTDQEGRGFRKPIQHTQRHGWHPCPVCSLTLGWLPVTGWGGPIFRRITRGQVGASALNPYSIALIVKARLREAGLAGNFGGHSLRAGLITEDALRGVDILTIQAMTGHQNINVLKSYIRREGDPFLGKNAAVEAGL